LTHKRFNYFVELVVQISSKMQQLGYMTAYACAPHMLEKETRIIMHSTYTDHKNNYSTNIMR
jgi:hypothetical protein